MGSPAIGIDLGTTYSCVGVLQHGKVEIIANDQGSRITSSCVAFTDKERLIGEVAKNQALRDPENAVFEVKRLMGRNFDDPNVQEDMQNWPFKVLDDNGRPKVQVKYKGVLKKFTAQEISAMVLSKMKATAEAYLGTTVKDAVITVPAYFNDTQRQATKDAAIIAGLNAERIINEPTAAALAYGLHKKLEGDRNMLVFDLGGGTFDVSILTIADGKTFKVLATAGDTHLGGTDFDNRIVKQFVHDFKRKYGRDVSSNERAMHKLRVECEHAKRALSTCTEAAVEIDSFHEGIYFQSRITRARFEMLCMDLFRRTMEIVKRALEDSHLGKSDIHEVVLVGGSTRIPKIQTMVKEFFEGKPVKMDINADEAVAYGATVQADILFGDSGAAAKDMVLVDVVPISLGTDKLKDGHRVMETIIQRNTAIPVKESQPFYTVQDYQTMVHVGVYQGEQKLVKDNHMLGEFRLSGLRSLPQGRTEVIVEFSIDADGILTVSACEKETGKSMQITVTNNRMSLSQQEVQRMLREAEHARCEDKARREIVVAMENLERYAYSAYQHVDEARGVLKESERSEICQRSLEVIEWMEENTSAGKDDLEQQLKKLQMEFESTLTKIRQLGPDAK